jgi:riboflavin transporter FmnP
LLSLKDTTFRRFIFSKEVFCMQTKNPAITARQKGSQRTRNIAVAAMLSAVAFILMFIEFPIPMLIPSFIKMDVSDLPALLGTFALGPVYGVVIELMKNLLHLLIKGTSSAGAGELCNFVLGAVFAFTAGMIYRVKKNRVGAILGSVIGALVMAVVSVPVNYFIVYPAYEVCYHMPMDAIIGMYQAILPSADSLIKCLVIFNLPFTFCKGLVDALLCYCIYKPLSPILHGNK